MLRELMEDNKHVAAAMRKAHKLCDDHEDSGTAGLLETFIDETERRTWFLFEASPPGRQQRGIGFTLSPAKRAVSKRSEKPVRGSQVLGLNRSPGSNFASLILATLSRKGRGCVSAINE